ncbi:hypothetical protein [Mesonia aquimarina]|uniref:hypothetical protein n=1 Tax=Mesonia aquimarina TaxID=1504967 RepID=UPI000EF59636|nr:hypothetical protein [Mesonia aquimarina]
MPTKTITILDSNGNALEGAHIIPENGEPTISDKNGMATVSVANANNDWVKITHVSGATANLPFADIDEMIHLGDNELQAVTITPKKKSLFPLLLIASAIGLAIHHQAKNQPVKVTL